MRVDQIDPATGKVGARAEVPLSVPEPSTQVAAGEPSAAGPSGERDGAKERPHADKQGMQATSKTAGRAAESPSAPDASHLAAETGGPARDGAVFVPEISTAKIIRGDNLWRISQRTYGRGERYTVIYDANQSQIRDPDLIYPGQIFVLPADKRG
ncbi:LysM peptidoglycan-binding domain-containing protein [Methylobacterium sp. P31]